MERLRYEQSTNPYKVGDNVKAFLGGRWFYGKVKELLDYEGSGLVFTGAILVCETYPGQPWPYPVAHGAVEPMVTQS